jgi:uncharacterized membrane protein
MTLYILTLVAALGCALIAGVFFAFSAFIMKALARIPSSHGIAAMQSINIVVLNRWFLGAFFGTGGICALLVIAALVTWNASSIYRVAGGALYVIGTLWVTIAFNVPRNNALARVTPEGSAGAEVWARYVSEWTAWNHVRTAAALAAAASFSLAL